MTMVKEGNEVEVVALPMTKQQLQREAHETLKAKSRSFAILSTQSHPTRHF